MHRRFRYLVVFILLALVAMPRAATPARAVEPAKPVLAYYYGWWGSQTWKPGQLSDQPIAYYESTDDDVMRQQIRAAKGAGIDGFICTWRYTCARLLELANSEGNFGVTFSVDPVGDGTLNSIDAIVANMNEMSGLTSNAAYIHLDGKPLFVFWNDTILPGPDDLNAWQNLRNRADPQRTQYWLGGGVNFDLLDVFDALHFFDITWENNNGDAMKSYSRNLNNYNTRKNATKPFIATVMPGYDDSRYRGGHKVVDRQNGDYYRTSWGNAIGYKPRAIIITSWNEWIEGTQIEPSQSYGNLYLDITRDKAAGYHNPTPPPPPPTGNGFADEAFERTWNRADKPVQEGRAARSWLWGPKLTAGVQEAYGGGTRLVQYFDKSRMEINNPSGDRSQPWFVTNGLLVMEMIRGQVQLGDSSFEARPPSNEALGGDPRTGNPDAPGYSALASVMTRQPDRTGQIITAQLNRNGSTQTITPPASVSYSHYVDQTGHTIPDVLWTFMNQRGSVYENGSYVNGKVMDWVFAFGYPVTDAYWMQAKLGGTDTWMLVQAFERRILTYTPTNPAAFQVEMGNVGQHYRRWRYGQ